MGPSVTFYEIPHEQRWPLFVRLADAALRKGKSLILHCADVAEARALDDHLWTHQDEAFLPHELVMPGGAPRDARARVVIVTDESRPIPAEILVQVTPTSEAFARGFETVIDVADQGDPQRLAASRERFRSWRAAGVVPSHKKG